MSAPRSTMRILATPTSRSRAEVRSAKKPPPMNRHSTVSLIGSRCVTAPAYVSTSYFASAGQFVGVLRETVGRYFNLRSRSSANLRLTLS
jgi:hypothetical protein